MIAATAIKPVLGRWTDNISVRFSWTLGRWYFINLESSTTPAQLSGNAPTRFKRAHLHSRVHNYLLDSSQNTKVSLQHDYSTLRMLKTF